jgi:4-hydroxy-tetrahydrodipicolinate synthase
MPTKFSGIFAALVTPLNEAGDVSCEISKPLMDFVVERGVSGVAVGGATAEYPHYELEQRKELMTCAAGHLRERVTLLAGIGGSTTRATLELGGHAVGVGYHALLLPMPHFFRYEQHDLTAFCETVARSLRAPCLLYNLPAFTNNLEVETAVRLLQQEEDIVGIKDSSGERRNLVRLAEARAQRAFSLLVGDDTLALEALEAGWDGVVSGIACFLPELLVCLYRNYRAGDYQRAYRCQCLLNELVVEIIKLPIPWGIRLGLEVRGIPTGPLPLPLSPVRKRQVSEYLRWLSEWLPRHLPVWAEVLT